MDPKETAQRVSLTRLTAILDRFPRLSLGKFPSPVSQVLMTDGKRFYLKDDGGSSDAYGGNKLRKLEFLLAAVRQSRKDRLVVHGDVESHTVQACGLLGRKAGFDVQAVLFSHRGQSYDLPELLRLSKAGVRIYRRNSMLTAILSAYLIAWRTKAYVVPLGASTPAATLGYVDAALELLQQVKAGQLPEPRSLFLPFATGGSVAGLLIGLALAGAATRVVAVQTVEGMIANQRRLERLVKNTLRLLGMGNGAFEQCLQHLELIDRRYLGRGYRDIPTATQMALLSAAQHGLCLEPAFSGKAFAAMLDSLLEYPDGELLFWNTHDRLNASVSNQSI